MKAPIQIKKEVARILARIANTTHHTTKRTVVLEAMARLTRSGFRIPSAMQIMICESMTSSETTRQLKHAAPTQANLNKAIASAPPQLLRTLQRLPYYISTQTGAGEPIWVYSPEASPGEWMANYALKREVAERVMLKANESRDIADFMIANGLQRLR